MSPEQKRPRVEKGNVMHKLLFVEVLVLHYITPSEGLYAK
jgi:hypothetical protein